MSTYKEIYGEKIKKESSNPSNPLEGQMWYNSTSGTLKVRLNVPGAFASGGVLPVGSSYAGSGGTNTATVYHHGLYGPGPQPNDNKTFEYNGTSWTETGACNQTMRILGSSGSQTSAMAFCGGLNPNNPSFPPQASNKTESYNGSSWTNETNFPATSVGNSGAGASETSTLSFGGTQPPGPSTTTASYNGSSWTAEPAMNNASRGSGGTGTETAALKTGSTASVPPQTNVTEEYNGSSWTSGNASSIERSSNFGTGGPQTAAFSGGGYGAGSYPLPNVAAAESYDGTNWATMANLANAGVRGGASMQTPNANALIMGGGTPYIGTSTEQFTAAFVGTKTVTTS